MLHDARNRNGIGEKIARREREERRRYRMDGHDRRRLAYARGGREQGVHLLETCSLYPLLIERSGPGLHWSGLDTPATPNRRTISQTLTSHLTLYT